MANWYLGVEGQIEGPFSEQQVQEQMNLGRINASTLVWREGYSGWLTLKQSGVDFKNATATTQNPLNSFSPNDTQHYGGFGVRCLAYFTDSIGVFLLSFGIGICSRIALTAMHVESEQMREILTRVASPLSWTISLFYFVVFQALFEGTPGKYLCGLRVVRDDYSSMSIGKAFMRYTYCTLSLIPLGFGLLSSAWHPKKQGWHDRWAKTLVVKADFLKTLRSHSEKQPASNQTLRLIVSHESNEKKVA